MEAPFKHLLCPPRNAVLLINLWAERALARILSSVRNRMDEASYLAMSAGWRERVETACSSGKNRAGEPERPASISWLLTALNFIFEVEIIKPMRRVIGGFHQRIHLKHEYLGWLRVNI